jgi:hypothetical protein
VTNITRVNNVTIVAPPAATASGRAFNTMVPTAPHLAAARPALVQARAPEPVNTRPLSVYTPGSRPPVLPHPEPVNAGTPARHGEAFAHEPESLHAGPGAAAPPIAHPPTAFAHDPQPARVSPEPVRAQPGEANDHRPVPQPQSDHRSAPQAQNANPPAQPQNAYHPAPQPQNASHPAPQPQNASHPAPQPQNASHPASQPQNEHHNAPPPQNEHQGGAAAHAQGGDARSHKPEAQSEHDAKHEPKGNEH